jgi:hypothetical protein
MTTDPQTTPVVRRRKRPVEVDTIQWTGDNETDVQAFTGGASKFYALDAEDREGSDDPEATATVFDELHSTWVLVYTGQHIVRGVKGEYYPIAEDVLAETYEPAVSSPPPDQTLRDRIASVLAKADGWQWVTDRDKARSSTYRSYQSRADAVLAALPPADRAAVLREAADIADEVVPPDLPRDDRDQGRVDAAADIRRQADFVELQQLRRLAAEAQRQPETRQPCACGQDGCEYCDVDEAEEDAEEQPDTETRVYDHRAWETYHRDAGCGCTDPNPVDCAIPHGTGAWLCVCHRLSGPPIKESDPPGTFLTAEQEAVRKHYRHPNRCLSVRGAFRCELGVDHGGDHRLKRTVWRDAPAAVAGSAAADTGEETDAIRLDEDGRDVETGHLPGCASQSYPDPGICHCEETDRG